MNQNEEWRPVPEFEKYEVSNLGNFRRRGTTKILKAGLAAGYLKITLPKNNVSYGKLVHRQVMAAFIGPRPSNIQVNHKNGIKTDNRLENLEYCTQRENARHAIETGLFKGKRDRGGFLSIDRVQEIRKDTRKYKTIAEHFNIAPGVVSGIKRGHSWRWVPWGDWRPVGDFSNLYCRNGHQMFGSGEVYFHRGKHRHCAVCSRENCRRRRSRSKAIAAGKEGE